MSCLLSCCDLPSFVFTFMAWFCQFSDFNLKRVTVLLHVNWSQEEDNLNYFVINNVSRKKRINL